MELEFFHGEVAAGFGGEGGEVEREAEEGAGDHGGAEAKQAERAVVLEGMEIEGEKKMRVDQGFFFFRLGGIGAGAGEVRDACGGGEGDFVAGVFHAELPVGFLGVHEEAFVEAADLLEHFPAEQHARADEPIDVAEGVVIPAAVVAQRFVAREERAYPGVFEPGAGGGREFETGELQGAVGVKEFWADEGDFGVGFEFFDEGGDCAGLGESVGVQKQKIFSGGDSHGLVVRRAEAFVVLVGDDVDLGELLLDGIDGAIVGGVVDDEDFVLDSVRVRDKRAQAIESHLAGVVGDDDGG